ncbi:MAG: SDR family NAD(P)-dependent oxidoreductase, partial [Candidatus Poribacteria bacterium]|nr:SDR family NAD(P)-dependent oxidoreductase [Candidatus Poribacteria bacterium]
MVAVVTGGAQGIGRAIVGALIDNGAQVAIVDIDKEAGK